MNYKHLYDSTSIKISRVVTTNYSTSFSMATRLLNKQQQDAIYAIYGFVRLADEIVDTFHDYPKDQLLLKLESDLNEAINQGISLNPILNAFQFFVHKYNIPHSYLRAFLSSMKADLHTNHYNTKQQANEYIYGSAEVVGLMCLKVFSNGDDELFEALKVPAMKLGSTFQKVNFLRDLNADMNGLGRVYFPELEAGIFNEQSKNLIIAEISSEFDEAYTGIRRLPHSSRIAVLTAYYYYKVLLMRIKKTPAEKIMESRIRISDFRKFTLLVKAKIASQFNLL